MKRSLSELQPAAGFIPLKRANSDVENLDENENSNLFHLQCQNQTLSLEVIRYKRTVAEARKELDMMRRKSREMETLVSVIQRAWSQLDIDSSLLLDSVGDYETGLPVGNDNSELLLRLLNCGRQYLLSDAMNIDRVKSMDVDEWSSTLEIEEEQERMKANILQSEEISQDVERTIEQNLADHANFTLNILEKLCIALSESTQMKDPEAIQALIQAKEFHSERLMLCDVISKLKAETIDVEAKLRITEHDKLRAEKRLDKALAILKKISGLKSDSSIEYSREIDLNFLLYQANSNALIKIEPKAEKGDATGASTSSVIGDAIVEGDGAVLISQAQAQLHAQAQNEYKSVEKELHRQVAVLERQLTESESAKSQVEMTLTERLARPLTQTEAQVGDMRRALEELRQQCKQRVSVLISEVISLQEKIANMEIALAQVEAVSTQRIEEVVQMTQNEIQKKTNEMEKMQQKLNSFQADMTFIEQLKTSTEEYQRHDEVRSEQVKRLNHQIELLTSTQTILKENMERSMSREKDLETSLEMKVFSLKGENEEQSMEAEAKADLESKDDGKALSFHNAEVLLKHKEERMKDLQNELTDARANINELILEIEAVSNEEMKTREQNSRLLRQIMDANSTQRGGIEENLRLLNKIDDVRVARAEAETKLEMVKRVMTQQDALIASLRTNEATLRGEFHQAKKASQENAAEKSGEEQKHLESSQKLKDAEHTIVSHQRRNEELLNRCNELTAQCETERKQRLETQRELKTKIATIRKGKSQGSAVAEDSRSTMNPEDSDMLDLTLNMLRCSVCKDRFKSAAIVRCFHLFCRECIDENLRNRHRKCPACGEKFGQDDVRSVFFTH